jgi:uncharacterized protein
VHPLDASGVHPERYALVEQMAADLGVAVSALIGNEALIASIDLSRYVQGDVGLPTLHDIVTELQKPGRDPREAFEPPAFRDDVQNPEDLVAGMVLEGVVTNIVAFGAFVDIGVHQDGLVHVSQLADRYVRDPNDVVQVGQKVQVTVQGVDLARGRIALSMRRDGGGARSGAGASDGARGEGDRQGERGRGDGRRGDGGRGDGGRGDGGRGDGGRGDGGRGDGGRGDGGRGDSTRGDGRRGALSGTNRPAPRPAVPAKPSAGFVAPNGMRFK